MKRLLLVLLAVLLVVSVGSAQMKSGMWGVQTSLGFANSGIAVPAAAASNVGVKFGFSDNLALRVELGFNSVSPAGGGGSSSNYGIGAAIQYYMSGGHGNVTPYVGGGFGYGGGSVAGGGTAATSLTVGGFFGGEYWFSSNFTAAGDIGLGFTSAGVSGATSTGIGTMSSMFHLTWYVN